jgi:hypothetical protein
MPQIPNKTRYFKNLERGKPPVREKYVPQYQLLDREPNPVDFGAEQNTVSRPTPGNKVEVVSRTPFASLTNPRLRPPTPMPVPYAEEGPSQIGNAPLPNVGNNVENSYTSLDDMTFDEEGNLVEPDIHPMLDNNQDDPINYADIPFQVPAPQQATLLEVQEPIADISTPQVDLGDGMLVVKGEIVSVASLALLEEEVRALILGEHPLSKDNNITFDDIVVFKRINIKAGIFLEDR